MNKAIFYITTEGVEVIDNTPMAEIRLSSMEHIEERCKREWKRKQRKNPLWKIACSCDIV